MKNQFTVRVTHNKKQKQTIARIIDGSKRGQCFTRPLVSEFQMESFWQAMEQHFGGKCFK